MSQLMCFAAAVSRDFEINCYFLWWYYQIWVSTDFRDMTSWRNLVKSRNTGICKPAVLILGEHSCVIKFGSQILLLSVIQKLNEITDYDLVETQSLNLPLSWERNETSEQSRICHAKRDALKKQTICSIYISYKWYGQYSKARLSGELCQKVNKNANLPLHNLLNLS